MDRTEAAIDLIIRFAQEVARGGPMSPENLQAAIDAGARAHFAALTTRVGYPFTEWDDPRLEGTNTREHCIRDAEIIIRAALPHLIGEEKEKDHG